MKVNFRTTWRSILLLNEKMWLIINFFVDVIVDDDGRSDRKMKKQMRNQPYSLGEMMLYDTIFDD